MRAVSLLCFGLAACAPSVDVTLQSIGGQSDPVLSRVEFLVIAGDRTGTTEAQEVPLPRLETLVLPASFEDSTLRVEITAFIGNTIVGRGATTVVPGQEEASILFALCSNGAVEAEELCDDGNLTDGDGCDSTCRPTGCGSNVFTEGEACYEQGPSIVANATASKTTVQDFDGDGRLDIIASYPTDGKARIFFGSENNAFGNFVEVDTIADSSLVAAADLDNDGLQDFVAANATLIRVFSNEGDSFPLAQGLLVKASLGDLALTDLSGDGIPEQIRTEFSQVIATNSVTVLQGVGDGTFSDIPANTNTGAQPSQLAIVDIDQDGDTDVLSLNLSGTVSVLVNNAGVLTQDLQVPTNGTPVFFAAADFNGDGLPDFAVIKQVGAGFISVFSQGAQPPISFQAAGDFAAPSNPKGITTADVDLDGDVDLLVTSESEATVTILLNNGQAQFTLAPPINTALNPTHITVGDINQDGLPDFITAGQDVGLILSNP